MANGESSSRNVTGHRAGVLVTLLCVVATAAVLLGVHAASPGGGRPSPSRSPLPSHRIV